MIPTGGTRVWRLVTLRTPVAVSAPSTRIRSKARGISVWWSAPTRTSTASRRPRSWSTGASPSKWRKRGSYRYHHRFKWAIWPWTSSETAVNQDRVPPITCHHSPSLAATFWIVVKNLIIAIVHKWITARNRSSSQRSIPATHSRRCRRTQYKWQLPQWGRSRSTKSTVWGKSMLLASRD